MKLFSSVLSLLILVVAGPFSGHAQNGHGPGPLPAPAFLSIESPRDQEVFAAGTPIRIQASAVDFAGAIYRVEFLDGSLVLGVSEILTLVAVPPGQPTHHHFEWKDAAEGSHTLTARATTSSGVVISSAPVHIQVGGKPQPGSIRILVPNELDRFSEGGVIPIVAEAIDPAGLIQAVTFLANGEKIGESVFDPCPPCDQPPCPERPCILPPVGAPLSHQFFWTNAPVGKYVLAVQGLTSQGITVTSPGVHVVVEPRAGSTAFLTFDAPDEGSVFHPGEAIKIQVTAVDLASEIRRVEFLSDGASIGVSEILTKDATIPGRPRVHQLLWLNPPAGPHTLLARAIDSTGQKIVSAERHIRVGAGSNLPRITVSTEVPYALEGDRLNWGKVTFQRTGDLTVPLTFQFEVSGEATRGKDYRLVLNPCELCARPDIELQGNSITFAAGEAQAVVAVAAVFDAQESPNEPPTESVVFRVAPPMVIAMVGALPPYEIVEPNLATVRIVDVAKQGVPLLVLTSPAPESKYPVGQTVLLEAVAYDPAGSIRRVAFFTDDQAIGLSEITRENSDIPGQLLVHHFAWATAQRGDFNLRAAATLADGTVLTSAKTPIHIQDPNDPGPIATLTIQTTKTPASEVGDWKSRVGMFEVQRRGGDLQKPLTIFFTVDGTATWGTDYRFSDAVTATPLFEPSDVLFHSATFPAGEATLTLPVEAVPDALLEGTETVVAHLIEPPFIPLIFPPPPASYRVGTPSGASLEILDRPAAEATIVILKPQAEDRVQLGTGVVIDTLAAQPGGLVNQVEFFANGEKIGESCFLCVVDAIFVPGTPLHNRIEWQPKAVGTYELIAVGHFGNQLKVTSAPVRIFVTEKTPTPRLTLTSPPDGSTVAANRPIRVTATGIGREGGITDVELLVDGRHAGESHVAFLRPPTADEPVQHEFEISLAAGTHELVVRDLLDPLVVSAPIRLVAQPTTTDAVLSWVLPANGSEHPAGKPIEMVVEARDPNGLILHLDFFVDGKLTGTSDFDCPQCKFAPGAAIRHRWLWSNPPSGSHVIEAVARNAAGEEVRSQALLLRVLGSTGSAITAVRTLPDVFQPGVKFTVTLQVKPTPEVRNYVVEEHPPFLFHGGAQPPPDQPYWNVTAVSDDGVFDVATGKIKFGPFFDSQPRTLTYEITPNQAAFESATFEGVVVADGMSFRITGDLVLTSETRHPADRDPADDAINAIELTAYGAAWKRGQDWPMGPNPIPVDYVTKAAALWRSGENYRFDSSAGAPPLCWVSNPFLPPTPPVDGSENADRFQGVAYRASSEASGSTSEVALTVLPAPGTQAFAVEEKVSQTPSAVSDGGVFDAATQTIRWGPFLDRQPRTLKYRLNAGTAIQAGVASFDGRSVRVASAPGPVETQGPKVVSMGPGKGGAMQIVIEDPSLSSGAAYELQMSSDLRQWTGMGRFVPEHSAGFARDDAPAEQGARFYRAVKVQ